jgi:hypothetical protein
MYETRDASSDRSNTTGKPSPYPETDLGKKASGTPDATCVSPAAALRL